MMGRHATIAGQSRDIAPGDVDALLTLPALWIRHKGECGPLGPIMAAARAGQVPGLMADGAGFRIVDQEAALAAIMEVSPCG